MRQCKYFDSIIHKVGRSGVMCAGIFTPMPGESPEIRRDLLKVHLKHICNKDPGRCDVAIALAREPKKPKGTYCGICNQIEGKRCKKYKKRLKAGEYIFGTVFERCAACRKGKSHVKPV